MSSRYDVNMNVLTIEIPWIVATEIDGGDDVRLARKVGGLAVEEMNNNLFVGGDEAEARRKVDSCTSHICLFM